MELKESYLSHIVCHHFSVNKSKCLINNMEMNIGDIETEDLNDFFIRPFANQRSEYKFIHPIDLKYNVVYKTMLDIIEGGNFVNNSLGLFNYLQSVSNLPTIKDGDVFIAEIEDVIVDDAYYDAIGIFKIESKNHFIETYISDSGDMKFTVKTGFMANKIDKACLVVFADKGPIGYIIDNTKETKFWTRDFLGMELVVNEYSQSKAAISLVQRFVDEQIPANTITKSEKIDIVNRCAEKIYSSDKIEMKSLADELFEDENTSDKFCEFKEEYEARENIKFNESFSVDKKAISVRKTNRRIKLDNNAEIYLLKSGDFYECGYDEKRDMNYYKIYYYNEK